MAIAVGIAGRKAAGGRQQYRDEPTLSSPLSVLEEAESHRPVKDFWTCTKHKADGICNKIFL